MRGESGAGGRDGSAGAGVCSCACDGFGGDCCGGGGEAEDADGRPAGTGWAVEFLGILASVGADVGFGGWIAGELSW